MLGSASLAFVLIIEGSPQLLRSFECDFPGAVHGLGRALFTSRVSRRVVHADAMFVSRLSRVSKVQAARAMGVLIVIACHSRLRILVFAGGHLRRYGLIFDRVLHLVGRRGHFYGAVCLCFPVICFSRNVSGCKE